MASTVQLIPWLIAVAALLALAVVVLLWKRPGRAKTAPPLPREWNVSARPLFSTDERRLYRQLREALPHHVVLAKLPLVRFCQPLDPQQVRYWYELLGAIQVSFVICSANGRVLAAVDLESERAHSRRSQQIKQAALGACRIRYLRCPADHFPSVSELQLLVPHNSASRGPQPAPSLHQARDNLTSTVASRRAQRTALWQDSSFFQDSFFSAEGREEGFAASEFTATRSQPVASASPPASSAGTATGPAAEPSTPAMPRG